MKEPSTTDALSFRKAAEALKHSDRTGRALRALVLAREQQTGQRIATRMRGAKRPKMQITLSAIYAHLPELKPHRTNDDMTRSVRAYIDAIEERISEVAADKVQELVMPHFNADRRRLTQLETDSDALRKQDTDTLELVEDLSRQVATLTGAKKAS
jgi:hypothetical protein